MILGNVPGELTVHLTRGDAFTCAMVLGTGVTWADLGGPPELVFGAGTRLVFPATVSDADPSRAVFSISDEAVGSVVDLEPSGRAVRAAFRVASVSWTVGAVVVDG